MQPNVKILVKVKTYEARRHGKRKPRKRSLLAATVGWVYDFTLPRLRTIVKEERK